MAQAAIQTEYAALGGAGGALGPAKGNVETDTAKGLSHVDYANGGIYYTLVDGAHAVYGDIYKKWVSAGGVKSNIGYPITDEASAIDVTGRDTRFNNFKYGGAIYWTPGDGAHLIYGNIWLKWLAAGGVRSNIGYPITDEATAPDNHCRFNDFKYGGAIYWTGENGAHLIYGNIWLKWLSIGGVKSNIGYPITDEASTSDNAARFNIFKNGGAIYWSQTSPASVTYGAIYQKYISLGGHGSFLKYPITDETSAGNHGGRYNDFKGGSIYWSPATGAHEHVGPLPDHLDFDANYTFPEGVAIGGNSHITLFKNGAVQFRTHFHDSGFPSYNYSVACVLKDADNQVYSLAHQGHTGGTLDSASRDNDFGPETRNNAAVAQNWRAIVATPTFHNEARVDVDVGGLVDEIVNIIKQAWPIVTAVISIF